jgi:hypothetical protein
MFFMKKAVLLRVAIPLAALAVVSLSSCPGPRFFDLRPGAISFTGTAVADGTNLDVSLPIQNLQSTAVSAAFDVDFYLALTSAFSPSTDTKLATVALTSGVPGSSSVTLGASLSIPELNINQVVYIYAVVDARGVMTETDETNNMSTAANAASVLVYDDENASRTYPVILETYSPSGSSTADTSMALYKDDGLGTITSAKYMEAVNPMGPGPGFAMIDKSASPLLPGTYYVVVVSWSPNNGPYAMAAKIAGIGNVAFVDLTSNTEDTYEPDESPNTWPLTLNKPIPGAPAILRVDSALNRYSANLDYDWFKLFLP